MSTTDHLVELELRVSEKFVAKATERAPQIDVDFDVESWIGDASTWQESEAVDPSIPQFPREQWVTYPARRIVNLILCDRMLDLDLDDAQWAQLCFLMQFGGKARVA